MKQCNKQDEKAKREEDELLVPVTPCKSGSTVTLESRVYINLVKKQDGPLIDPRSCVNQNVASGTVLQQ